MSDELPPGEFWVDVGGTRLHAHRRGSGPPLLLLHGMQSFSGREPFIDLLARHAEVIAPDHPGFGQSPRPDGFESVYDLVQLYSGLLDQLGSGDVTLVGLSFGGWIAAEIATLRPRQLGRLVLVDAFGIKVSDRETPDILDVFNRHPDLVRKATWHDPARHAPDYDAMSDKDLGVIARNWDALCLYGWSPYMHNPRLKRWLHKVEAPALVLWGASDGMVKPSYGRAYAGLIPEARFALIDKAGHRPEIEQPDAVAEQIRSFMAATSAKAGR